MNSLNLIYKKLVNDLFEEGLNVGNTIELINYNFVLDNPEDCIITSYGKSPQLKYLLAENIWYASGHNDKKFIAHFASLWNKLSDDGATNNSAYGYIMRYKFGFNQISKIIELLQFDKNTRRACIIINDANENVIETHDEQCTMYLQFFIRNNKLDLIVNMRSNDIIFGLPYDVPAFVFLQKYIAWRLEIPVGKYYHHAGSLHCYNKDLIKMTEIDRLGFSEQKYKINPINLYVRADRIYDAIKARLTLNIDDDIIGICEKFKVLERIK